MIQTQGGTKTGNLIKAKSLHQRKLSFADSIVLQAERTKAGISKEKCTPRKAFNEDERQACITPQNDQKMFIDSQSPALTQKPSFQENGNSLPPASEIRCCTPITPITTPLLRHSMQPAFLSLYEGKSQEQPSTPQKAMHRRNSYSGTSNQLSFKKSSSNSARKSRITNKLRKIQGENRATLPTTNETIVHASPTPPFGALSQSFIKRPICSQSMVNSPTDCLSQSCSQFTQPMTFAQTGYYSEFQELNLLGSGNFGKVYAVERKLDSSTFAIKQIPFSSGNSYVRSNSIREIQAMSFACKGSHVVQLHHAWIEGDSHQQTIFVMMELCPGGSLYQLLMSKISEEKRFLSEAAIITNANIPRHTYFDELQIVDILGQIALALHSCHSREIAHCDVKLENILLDYEGRLKLTDFGLAQRSTALSEVCDGSPSFQNKSFSNTDLMHEDGDARYISLDMLNEKKHLFKGDVFALGMCMYELMSGDPLPKNGQAHTDLRTTDLVLRRLQQKQSYCDNLVNLVFQMVAPSPADRPSPVMILHNQLFESLRVNVLRERPHLSMVQRSLLCTVSEIDLTLHQMASYTES